MITQEQIDAAQRIVHTLEHLGFPNRAAVVQDLINEIKALQPLQPVLAALHRDADIYGVGFLSLQAGMLSRLHPTDVQLKSRQPPNHSGARPVL